MFQPVAGTGQHTTLLINIYIHEIKFTSSTTFSHSCNYLNTILHSLILTLCLSKPSRDILQSINGIIPVLIWTKQISTPGVSSSKHHRLHYQSLPTSVWPGPHTVPQQWRWECSRSCQNPRTPALTRSTPRPASCRCRQGPVRCSPAGS